MAQAILNALGRLTLTFAEAKQIIAAVKIKMTVFDGFPLEVNEMVALNVQNDKDIANFRLVCRATKNAVDANDGTFWRKRFHQVYDAREPLVGVSRLAVNEDYRKAYQRRRHYLKRGVVFNTRGYKESEARLLRLLRDLIIESNPHSSDGSSRNLEYIARFLDSFNLPLSIFRQKHATAYTPLTHGLYNTIVVTLTHFFFQLDRLGRPKSPTNHFPDSQQVAYATAASRPIFTGQRGYEIDMDWCMHMVNFWKYHLTREVEMTLYNDFSTLVAGDRPKAWKKKLTTGPQKLGQFWKGSYAFLEQAQVDKVRAGRNQDEGNPVLDCLNSEVDDKCFQHLEINFPDADKSSNQSDMEWPSLFEYVLNSHAPPRLGEDPRIKTRAQRRSGSGAVEVNSEPIMFLGVGVDNVENFMAKGFLNEMPPQNGIPGWQRLTMMKYYVDDFGAVDEGALWAYEGVVLPGGMIILGRWWNPNPNIPNQTATQYSGPFILWNVDDNAEDDGEIEDAWPDFDGVHYQDKLKLD